MITDALYQYTRDLLALQTYTNKQVTEITGLGKNVVKDIESDAGKLAASMKTMLGISPKVHLVAPKTIARSEGKAVRVIDKRKLHD